MTTTKKSKVKHYSGYNVQTICDVEIPLNSAGGEPRFEYQKFECGDLIRRGNERSHFLLLQTCDYPEERRTSISIFDSVSDMVYYVQQMLTQTVNLYQVANIYTRNNFWHNVIKSWKYVKHHVKQYDC